MHTPHLELPFFTNLLILLVSARIFGEIFERFKQPAMLGEIIAGIVLGPSLLGIIHRTDEINVISDLGIFLLVILAGLEIDIDDIVKSLSGKNIFISLSAFFIPLFSGQLVGYWLGEDTMSSIFIGLCVAITALPVSVRILMDLDKLNTEEGQKIISVAIFDDVIALTILGILVSIKDTDMSLIAISKVGFYSLLKLTVFIISLTLVYLLIKKLTNKGNYIEDSIDRLISFFRGKESLFALFFVFVLLFATFTESLGLHFIVGAFFASMLISDKIIGKRNLKRIENTTSHIAMGFLTPIFFAGIGLEFNIYSLQNFVLLVAVLIVSYLSKIFGGYFGARIAGYNSKFAFTLGFGLNARGIMGLVIANIAFKSNYIDEEVFSILVIMGVLTTLTTPIILKKLMNKPVNINSTN